MKPRKQSFLLSVDAADNHIVSNVNKHKLPKAAGFTNEQCVVLNNKLYALGDQYSIQTNSPLQEAKNLFMLEFKKWEIKKLSE